MESEKIQLGIIYRTWQELGFLFGIGWERFKFIYSFDYNLALYTTIHTDFTK